LAWYLAWGAQATDVEDVIARVKAARARADPKGVSIGYHGNVVTLWEALARESDLLVDLGSDQTSLHNPFGGGYYPVQLSFEEAQVGWLGVAWLGSEPALLPTLPFFFLHAHTHIILSLVMTPWQWTCIAIGQDVMVSDPPRFKALVQESLIRQVTAINTLTARGMAFWDYGNSFLLEASRAGADVLAAGAGSGAGGPSFR
jgi:urocanate hydratase